MKNQTNAERKSERELVSSRIINGPPRLVFEAWTNPELFKKWWVPKSAPITLVSCEIDVRTGGTYHLAFSAGGQSAEFFGKYLEVIPYSRLVWTNEEGGVDAATDFLFDPAQMDTVVRGAMGRNGKLSNFELLLETTLYLGGSMKSKVIAERIH